MKKFKYWSIILLTALTLPLMVACGGDDDGSNTPQDSMVTEGRSGDVKKLCDMFGINADDYYDYWMPLEIDGKIVISLANKQNNKILVAVYDTNKKSVIYTNTDMSFSTTLNMPSYEDTFEGKLANIYPRFCETKNGFIIDALVWYNENGEVDAGSAFDKVYCIQNLYFYDGSTTKTKQMEASSNSFNEIIYWYDNSCVLKERLGNYYCYTDKGELKFSDKWIMSGENFPLSYSQYINIDLSSRLIFNKYDILNPEYDGMGGKSIWSTTLQLVDNYTSDVIVTYTIKDKSTSDWSITAKFVWENGTTKIVNFSLNVETGTYKVLDNG